MIQVGIIGGAGYVAGELIRCLVHHPHTEINFIYSESQHGSLVEETHQDLFNLNSMKFTNQLNTHVDVVFLCLGHGNSKAFLNTHSFSDKTKIVDLSTDFRLNEDASFKDSSFVYGLTDLNKLKIKEANYIANPGCFATAIQLALLPLADANLLKNDVHINAITGSTGAGQKPTETSHFSWRNNNISIYKAFNHQHLGEIKETIATLQEDSVEINFLPVRGDFTRGIFATVYTECELSEEELIKLYMNFYKDEPFTFISKNTISLKQVVNTNNCLLQVQKIKNKVLITSIIDNLLKGAAGQAIQNMNLMFGIDETTGLNFKANYF